MKKELSKQKKVRIDKIIGQNIRRERDLRKMSREELAEALDLTVSHMGLIERGERGATAVTLDELSTTLGVSIDSLFASPDKKSLSVKEGETDISRLRRKVITMVNRLYEHEIKLIIHIIKGIISYRIDFEDDEDDNEEG
ncbi:MAG: helix-turn-helix domain-containing protein [Defluviitaleaceae bacterium]|nr:helix-turn-helix domain-containing protein [Defluviitaleaceae bacterium]